MADHGCGDCNGEGCAWCDGEGREGDGEPCSDCNGTRACPTCGSVPKAPAPPPRTLLDRDPRSPIPGQLDLFPEPPR